MADRREVVITIKASSIESPQEKVQEIVNSNVKDVIESGGSGKTTPSYDDGTTLGKSVVVNQAFQALKSAVVTEGKYQINRYFVTHDDYVGQRNMNIAFSLVDSAVQFGSSVASGAMIGGIPGAIVAGLASAISKGISVYNNLDEQNLMIQKNNAQLAFTRQRSGYSLTSESMGEDK